MAWQNVIPAYISTRWIACAKCLHAELKDQAVTISGGALIPTLELARPCRFLKKNIKNCIPLVINDAKP